MRAELVAKLLERQTAETDRLFAALASLPGAGAPTAGLPARSDVRPAPAGLRAWALCRPY